MTQVEMDRINAIATARAVKATRLLITAIMHKPRHVESPDQFVEYLVNMNDRKRDLMVRMAGVKTASRDTWRVVEQTAQTMRNLGEQGQLDE